MELWKKKLTPFVLSNLICLLFIFLSLWKVPAESILVADNQTKILQAQAFLDSGFQSQYSKCKILAELGGCSYSVGGKGKDEPILYGVFPVAFSLFAAIVRLTGDYTHLVYASVLFFLAGTWLVSFRIRKDFWIPIVLTIGPCFFHSFLFPDYAIVYFLVAGFIAFYYKPLSGIYSSFIIGLLTGGSVFFRPETVFLPFLLGIFSLFHIFANGPPKRNSEEATRLSLLMGYGFSVLLFFSMNYSLYGSFLGTRIAANEKGIESFWEWRKYISLLFYGNGRVGFFLFSPWALFGIVYLGIRFRSLSRSEKDLLSSTIASIFLIVLLSPNDSNIDWGTRYLSWLTIPIAILFFTRDFTGLPNEIKWKRVAISLLTVNLLISYVFFRIQVKVAQEFQKYNSLLTGLSGEVIILTEPSIVGFYGKDILEKRVMLISNSESKKKIAEFLSGKISRLDLVRYEPATSFLLQGMRQDLGEKSEVLLEKELLKQGWKLSERRIAWKLEILNFSR